MKKLFIIFLFYSSFSIAETNEATLINPFIVGGNRVSAAEYPYIANLVVENSNNPNILVPFCGGTILDPYHILTAAHCIYDIQSDELSDIKVIIESSDAQDLFAFQRTSVKTIFYLGSYDPITLENDIAILELQEALPNYVETIHRVELGDLSEQGYRNENEMLTILGYGRFNSDNGGFNVNVELMKASVNYVSSERCDHWSGITVTDKLICTSGDTIQNSTLLTATCQGDSGGPLLWNQDGVEQQIGIVSFGPSVCGDASLNSQSVFTDVSQYKWWILDILEGKVLEETITVDSFDGSDRSEEAEAASVSLLSFFTLFLLACYRRYY